MQPDLRPVRVSRNAHALPADGLTLVAGSAAKAEGFVHLPFGGEYPTVLWTPGLIRESIITVGRGGSTDNGWRVVTWPSPDHYFSTHLPPRPGNEIPELREVPPYHVVSQGEYQLVMEQRLAPAEQRNRPMQQMHSTLVRDFMQEVGRHGLALPDRQRAIQLSADLNYGVWFQDGQRLYYHGSPEANQAILVVVPN